MKFKVGDKVRIKGYKGLLEEFNNYETIIIGTDKRISLIEIRERPGYKARIEGKYLELITYNHKFLQDIVDEV